MDCTYRLKHVKIIYILGHTCTRPPSCQSATLRAHRYNDRSRMTTGKTHIERGFGPKARSLPLQ